MNNINGLERLNIIYSMLRKIGFDGINKDKVPFAFDSLELNLLETFKQEQIASYNWVKVSCHDDYQNLELTKKGKVMLFKDNNFEAVNDFILVLASLRYDVTLLDDFLMTMDLEKNPFDILNKEEFELFCQTYDRSINFQKSL